MHRLFVGRAGVTGNKKGFVILIGINQPLAIDVVVVMGFENWDVVGWKRRSNGYILVPFAFACEVRIAGKADHTTSPLVMAVRSIMTATSRSG